MIVRASTGGAKPILKSPREIELMSQAGAVVCRVLDRTGELVRPGVTTAELNEEAERIIAQAGGIALFKGVTHPQAEFAFPAALCTSVNEQVVHGIPGSRRLRQGDLLSVDCGVKLKGYCGDAARSFAVGRVVPEVQKLLEVTRQALELAVSEMRPHRCWSEVAELMQRHVEQAGFSIVRDFVGHGIGQEMHEEPKVANYYDRSQAKHDFDMRPGMVLAVEPMVNVGRPAVEYGDATGWLVVTKDRKWSAHFEHTIAITADGVRVLTTTD